MMNLSRRAYVITKDEMVRPPLLFWLEDHGFDRHKDIVFVHEKRDECVAKAAAIKRAIDDNVGIAVFCEADAIPSSVKTDSFFSENRYAVQCVKYETETSHSFDRHDDFHALIWRASRCSLLKMAQSAKSLGKKLCEWETSEHGDSVIECGCASIKRLAKHAGLSTGWVGVAGHVPKAKSDIPRICRYAA